MNIENYQKLEEKELIQRIDAAKAEKNAILLVHNYVRMDVQHIADFLGDSLGLSRKAAETDAQLIVFCGVDFMAESAKILSPTKTVLHPDDSATCPMAGMATAKAVRKKKAEIAEEYGEAPLVVCYVNSSAAVKAESYVCCTSSNAVKIVNALPDDKPILFVPDKNLGAYTKKMTGKNVILWDGYCYVHNNIGLKHVARIEKKYPGYKKYFHPECPPEVLEKADYVASTSGMATAAEDEDNVVFGTEVGLIDQLQEKYPDKEFYPLKDDAVCKTMKLITLPKVCWSIENEQHQVEIQESVRIKAKEALDRMLEMS